jgi:hypothetical protein
LIAISLRHKINPPMPPPDPFGPPCPNCGSSETERLPFSDKTALQPVYSCSSCSHAWQQPPAPPALEKQKEDTKANRRATEPGNA